MILVIKGGNGLKISKGCARDDIICKKSSTRRLQAANGESSFDSGRLTAKLCHYDVVVTYIQTLSISCLYG